VTTIAFGSDSQLRRIDGFAFLFCASLESICIPAHVDTIAGTAFVKSGLREIRIDEDNRHFRVSGDFLLSFDGRFVICYFGRESNILVDREIEVICDSAFRAARNLASIEFGSDSKLRRIDSYALSWARLRSIHIPSCVEMIDGSAFANSDICAITVAEGNLHFRVSGEFLLNFDGTSLIRYFGRACHVTVGREIEIVSVGSFASCRRLRILEFECSSKLVRIEPRAMDKCRMLRCICLPRSTSILCDSCFRKCTSLLEVKFDMSSQLSRIEAGSFVGCSSLRSISLPISMKGDANVDLTGATGIPIFWSE
jgi:hypothetical protein